MTVIGAMYAAVLFVGISNCSTVQPIVATERTVFYREKAAGMYAALPYAMSQVSNHNRNHNHAFSSRFQEIQNLIERPGNLPCRLFVKYHMFLFKLHFTLS